MNQNKKQTARLRYTEHSTPKIDEYLSLLMALGRDMGNNIPNYDLIRKLILTEKTKPQNIWPLGDGDMKSATLSVKIKII